MLPSVLIYGGALLALAAAAAVLGGAISWARRRAGPPWRAAVVALAGAALATLGFAWPISAPRTPATGQLIDRFLPTDDFHEFHSARLRATPARTFAAIHAVTPSEIRWLLPLFWMRSPRGGFGPAERELLRQPMLDLMTRRDFLVLAERPGEEYVFGTVLGLERAEGAAVSTPEEFGEFADPGFARVAMNFKVRDLGAGGVELTTETRVSCTDAVTRRKFGRYWRLIYPGSSIIRAEWLDAIRRRAEASAG